MPGLEVMQPYDATITNLTESLLDFLSGRNKANNALSAGVILVANNSEKTFGEVFTSSAAPRLATIDVALDDIMRQKSPLLLVTPAIPSDVDNDYGHMRGIRTYDARVLMYARVWGALSGDRLDHLKTTRQFVNAIEVMQRVMLSAHGNIPIWDYSKATVGDIFSAPIGYMQFEDDRSPIIRSDRYEAEWHVRLGVQTELR